MAKFFRFPFGVAGDRTAIPDLAQIDGSVSYQEAYPFDYQRPIGDTDRKEIERDKQNDLFYQITLALQQYQTQGFPDFITSDENGGSPYSYGVSAYVRWDDGNGFAVYESLANLNTSLPSDVTKWKRVRYDSIPISAGMDFWGSELPAGFLWGDAKTIGSAASGATNRANADTFPLFSVLWNSHTNAVLPIQDSSGNASTRGASALADFNANKRLPIIDKRGRVSAGRDDMGGTPANRLNNDPSGGVVGNVLGASGGSQGVGLTSNNNGPHGHASGTLVTDNAGEHAHSLTAQWSTSSSSGSDGWFRGVRGGDTSRSTSNAGLHNHTLSGATASSGLGEAHNNVQPTIVCNYIIKM